MFRPTQYQETNSAPREDAHYYLEQNAPKMNWQKINSIIDIGCGDGSVTCGVLKQFLPPSYRRLMGCDVSKTMVKHATEVHSDHRTSFAVWDMRTTVPQEYIDSFDLVFSNYAIHWVQEQENVFKNVFGLLKEGGECLLIFIAYIPIYDVYRVLAKQEKWADWLRDSESYISPYQDLEKPEKRVRSIMAEIGFNNIDVQCENRTHLYELNHFRMTMEAISPFNIPADLHSEYMKNYMEVVRDIMPITQKGDKEILKLNYSILIARAAK